MSKRLLSIICLLFSFAAFSQNITIRGKIIDKTSQLPLESATIYLTSVKDSTMIDYTISDKNGVFSLNTKKIKQPVFLKISFIGFDDYKQEVADVLQDKDFGILYVEEARNELNEVVVRSEAPPVRIKQDTLEFNASSFKVRPDANVEALLKQLPGVEIDANGKIKVNGKEVNNILVNGKPFFGKDGKIATENLPSDIIDKVQITDTKTKEEELTGQAATSDEKTINLTIQKDKNKGLFGKFGAGKGSDDRYESSGLINYFKDEQKFSFLGSSNNINSIGFSMDEIFDSMGGGRNIYTSSDGTFSIDGQQFGGGNGITKSNMVGINYTDSFAKKIEPAVSYFFTSSETNNDNKTKELNLLPDAQSFTTESLSKTRKISDGHNLNFELQYKIDSLTTLNISPSLKKSQSRYTSGRSQRTLDDQGALLNDYNGYSNTDSDNTNFENSMYFVRRMKKKGRSISIRLSNENKDDESDMLTKSQTNFYQGDNPDIARNQVRKTANVYDKYIASAVYTEPITDSLSISFGERYSTQKSVDHQNTFDFDNGDNDYTALNDLQSNYFYSKTNTLHSFAYLGIRKKKYSFRIDVGAEVTKFNNFSKYLGDKYTLNKDYVFPTLEGYVSYRLNKSKSIYMNYNYENGLPTAGQLLPVTDLSNPLNTITGNPDLKPSQSHNMYLGFNNYDYATRSGFYLYAGGSIMNNQVVSSTVYDESFKSTTTFENTGSTNRGYAGFNYNKTKKIGKHNFGYGAGIDSYFNLDKGLTNNEAYESHSYNISPKVDFSYEYGDFITLRPSYTYSFNHSNYTNFTVDKTTAFVHTMKFEATTRWPKHWVFGNDFGYTYNSNIADGFQKDFYLWNSSLGYNFYNDKFLLKIKVYDILNQNTNSSRNISATSISDVQNTVLKRYAMFSLTYKIEKFGGKKKNPWEQ